MSTIRQLFNPPSPSFDKDGQYRYNNNIYDVMNGLIFMMNPSVVSNANFSTLGSNGMTAITQANGDGAEFSSNWNVFGASVATYALTPTVYPTGVISSNSPSLVQSASPYYINALVTSYTSGDFYIYQRQPLTVRKYQKNDMTMSIWIFNNLSSIPLVQAEIFTFYDPSNETSINKTFSLQPGLNKLGVTIRTPDLVSKTLGAANYVDFRLRFLSLGAATANINFHQIKSEFGTVTTLLNQ